MTLARISIVRSQRCGTSDHRHLGICHHHSKFTITAVAVHIGGHCSYSGAADREQVGEADLVFFCFTIIDKVFDRCYTAGIGCCCSEALS